jgi:asparagine synthase (glutamine-hydrolysing)
MCGIAGIVSLQPTKHIGPMLESIEHRGRDDQGQWISNPIDETGAQVCFGHRRLSIIDTTVGGHEPMFSHDDRYVLTFNGEIYNYRELREQLIGLGHRFRSDSDAEVLLTAFANWGLDCIARLNGMFAFAIWDKRDRTLTLARDHVGIKPLYYAHQPGRAFVFASEIKAILASKVITPAINPEALHQFLTFLWSPDPLTLFAEIKTVPPGHVLQFHDDEIKLSKWWDVSFEEIEQGKDEKWWRQRVLETLDRVVKMEMVSDVPLGSFLSGGIDSSSIVAMMQHHSDGRPISTYTVGMSSADLRYDIIPDDVRWARRVNEQLQTDYHEIILQPSVAELLPKLVYHMEEPPIDMAIPSYLISKAARETLTVMLSGMGGDEVFAGYPRQMAMRIASAFDPVPISCGGR